MLPRPRCKACTFKRGACLWEVARRIRRGGPPHARGARGGPRACRAVPAHFAGMPSILNVVVLQMGHANSNAGCRAGCGSFFGGGCAALDAAAAGLGASG
eukprot:366072-Chlamydomonas_euryale.AAC.14